MVGPRGVGQGGAEQGGVGEAMADRPLAELQQVVVADVGSGMAAASEQGGSIEAIAVRESKSIRRLRLPLPLGPRLARMIRRRRSANGPTVRRSSRPEARSPFAVIPAKDFKKRMVVEIDGLPHLIEQIIVQTPSARGAATLYKVRARNLKTRQRVDKTFKGTDSLAESSFERRPMQFLYRDDEAFHFMDARASTSSPCPPRAWKTSPRS